MPVLGTGDPGPVCGWNFFFDLILCETIEVQFQDWYYGQVGKVMGRFEGLGISL